MNSPKINITKRVDADGNITEDGYVILKEFMSEIRASQYIVNFYSPKRHPTDEDIQELIRKRKIALRYLFSSAKLSFEEVEYEYIFKLYPQYFDVDGIKNWYRSHTLVRREKKARFEVDVVETLQRENPTKKRLFDGVSQSSALELLQKDRDELAGLLKQYDAKIEELKKLIFD